MNTRHLLLAALLAGAFSPALAWQSGAPAALDAEAMEAEGDPVPGPARREVRDIRDHVVMHRPGPGHAMMEHFGPGLMHHGKAVKNAPYSAEAVNELQRNLSDGNQIVTKTSTLSYRDSAGRMRQETRDHTGVLRNITIVDPNEGITYVLQPDAKSAMKIGPHREIARIAGDRARLHAEAMRGAEAGKHVIIKRIERDAEREARAGLREGGRQREEIRVLVDKEMAGRGPMAGLDRIGPALAGALGDGKWSSRATVKDLGTKEIDGIKAQGKLRSYEIPAGEIGNRNPIVVSTESWYSPELQVTMMTRHSDPRSGERTYRLSSVKRDEPAASLFTVPSDYTVRDTMAEIRKSIDIKKDGGK